MFGSSKQTFGERAVFLKYSLQIIMKRKIYVETSIISYLTSRPSKEIIGAAHQQITAMWWVHREQYELFVSRAVWQ